MCIIKTKQLQTIYYSLNSLLSIKKFNNKRRVIRAHWLVAYNIFSSNIYSGTHFYFSKGDHGFLLPEYELITEPEDTEDDQQSDDDEEDKYSKYLTPEDAINDETKEMKIEELQKMAVKETKEDKTFLTFKKRVDKDPDQVCYIFFLNYLLF